LRSAWNRNVHASPAVSGRQVTSNIRGSRSVSSEEIIRGLAEQGVLRREGNTWVATGDVDRWAIPGTLHGVLAARIDGLPAGAKRALQRAAVVGRFFKHRALQALREGDPAADQREDVRHLVVARARRGVKLEAVRVRLAEYPVEYEGVKMGVCIQAAACALNYGDGPRPPSVDAARAGVARIGVAQHARVHAEHRPAQAVVERHAVAQPVRHGEDPLPHRHPR
jgi:hypothetical protein